MSISELRWDRFDIGLFLSWFEENFFRGEPALGVMFFLTDDGGIVADNITVKDDHADITATVQFVDSESQPTTPDTTPVWASDNENAATVTAAEDGLTGTVHVGSPGAAIISVTTTNSQGDEIRAQGTITVIPGDVAIGTIDFGNV